LVNELASCVHGTANNSDSSVPSGHRLLCIGTLTQMSSVAGIICGGDLFNDGARIALAAFDYESFWSGALRLGETSRGVVRHDKTRRGRAAQGKI
jgi:hypothetical protein